MQELVLVADSLVDVSQWTAADKALLAREIRQDAAPARVVADIVRRTMSEAKSAMETTDAGSALGARIGQGDPSREQCLATAGATIVW